MISQNAHIPMVSVVMPAYNAEAYIARSIESVLAQSFSDLELVVIDDGSQDGTAEVVSRIAKKDSRVRLCPNEQNMGTARSRNRGMDLCRGSYVAFLDSDDLWRQDKLEKQLARMDCTGADLVYTSYAIVDMAGQKRCRDFCVPASVNLDGLLKENVIGCSTVLLSKAAMERYRFFPDYYHEDYALWLQMLRDGCTMVGVDEVLVDYCYRADSRAGNKLFSAKCRWHIYRTFLGMSWWKSAWYLLHYAMAGLDKYRKRRDVKQAE